MNKRDNYLIKIMAKLIWSDRSALLSDPTASGKSFLLDPSVPGVQLMGPRLGVAGWGGAGQGLKSAGRGWAGQGEKARKSTNSQNFTKLRKRKI